MALPEIKSVADLKGKTVGGHPLRLVNGFCPALSHAEKRGRLNGTLLRIKKAHRLNLKRAITIAPSHFARKGDIN